jgi:hypothetical protein
MTVVFYDCIGLLSVSGVTSVQFFDGFVYFDNGNIDYKIPVSDVVEIAIDC